jgi:hypothetical protein
MEACTAVHHIVQIYGHSVLEGIDTPLNMNASDVGQFPDPFANRTRPSSSVGLFAVGRGVVAAFGR